MPLRSGSVSAETGFYQLAKGGENMFRWNTRGFTLIELMIVISIILVLMALVVVVAPAIFATVRDMQCQNNLKQIYTALLNYHNKFNQYPDKGGDLFLAMLYHTGVLNDKDTFLCPEDAIKNNAHWETEGQNRTDWKFLYPGESPKVTESGSIWPDLEWDDETFLPWEISYAGRRNDPLEESGEGGTSFFLRGPPRESVPIVSDDQEDENGEQSESYIHTDHVNILMTDGKVEKKALLVGVKVTKTDVDFDLEALQN